MTTRTVNGEAFNLGYDAENRLISVTGPNLTASFVYDADGRQVKATINGETTLYVGQHYEAVVNGAVTKYYFAGTQRIALRKDGVLNFVMGDHLGSTSLTTDENGNELASMRYKAWGETRHATGNLNTDYQYTGQRTVGEIGLHFYREASLWDNARWYDSSLSRFTSADTIIPSTQGVQGWDRFAYTNNNPVRYTDPSGHCAVKPGMKCPTDPKINASSVTKTISGRILGGFRAYPSQGQIESEPPSSFEEIRKKSMGSGVAGSSEAAASIINDAESYILYLNEIKDIQNSPENVMVTLSYDYHTDTHQWSFNGINIANNSNTRVGLGLVSVNSGVYTNLGEHSDVLYQGVPIIVKPGEERYVPLDEHYQTYNSCSSSCPADNPVIVDVVSVHFAFVTTVTFDLPSPTSFLTSSSSSNPLWNP
jgi:RHS repeat-associated protein